MRGRLIANNQYLTGYGLHSKSRDFVQYQWRELMYRPVAFVLMVSGLVSCASADRTPHSTTAPSAAVASSTQASTMKSATSTAQTADARQVLLKADPDAE